MALDTELFNADQKGMILEIIQNKAGDNTRLIHNAVLIDFKFLHTAKIKLGISGIIKINAGNGLDLRILLQQEGPPLIG